MSNISSVYAWIYSRWGWLAITGIVILSIIIIVLFGSLLNLQPWSDLAPDRAEQYAEEHCEAISKDSFLVQQANFWSNFAYLAVGLLIWLRNRTVMGVWTGAMFCFLSIGSGFFHGTLTSSGQYLDIIGIYAVLTALIIKGVFETFNLQSPGPVLGGILFTSGLVLSIIAGVFKNDFILFDSDIWTLLLAVSLALLIVIRSILDLLGRKTLWILDRWFISTIMIASFIAAGIFKFGDGEGNFLCNLLGSNPVLQGHALWHLSSAVGLYCVWALFDSLRSGTGNTQP